ncbi:hypothetical protein ISCGN_004783 [Ixodes scapularis]
MALSDKGDIVESRCECPPGPQSAAHVVATALYAALNGLSKTDLPQQWLQRPKSSMPRQLHHALSILGVLLHFRKNPTRLSYVVAKCRCRGESRILRRMRGIVGRKTSFEVEINGVLVFSKMEKKGFPVFDEIVQRVIDASKNMEVQPATSIDKSWCCIL